MNEDFINKEMSLMALKISNIEKKLSIAITGLKVIVSDGNSLGVAQKTLEEIEKIELQQEQSEKE